MKQFSMPNLIRCKTCLLSICCGINTSSQLFMVPFVCENVFDSNLVIQLKTQLYWQSFIAGKFSFFPDRFSILFVYLYDEVKFDNVVLAS